LWIYSTGAYYVGSSPAVANGVVYIGSSFDLNSGTVWALNARTGAKLWAYGTNNCVCASPAVSNGMVYVGSSLDVYAFGLK
jgi:outer membrane protein assembly factor BamB